MIKLGKQRKDLRPIDLLLRQLKLRDVREKQSKIEEEIDKQYEMLREGRKMEMVKRTKMSENIDEEKTKTDKVRNNIVSKLKEEKTIKPPKLPIHAPPAPSYITPPTPSYITPDLVVDYHKGQAFIKKNPIVKDLEIQEKLKDLKEIKESSDAYKLGKQDKERMSKINKPETSIKMGYDVGEVAGSSTI